MDEERRQRIRQELLELYCSGANGIACAPMPGTLLEMLELAAVKRRSNSAFHPVVENAAEELLTRKRHAGPISAVLARIGKALRHVAGRPEAANNAGRMPA